MRVLHQVIKRYKEPTWPPTLNPIRLLADRLLRVEIGLHEIGIMEIRRHYKSIPVLIRPRPQLVTDSRLCRAGSSV